MANVWRCVWLLVALFAAVPRLFAASPAEDTTFDAAATSFKETVWDRAEAEFGAFARTFTNSTRLPEAILFQAQARFKLTNYTGVVELLTSQQSRAGKLADEYLFWIAEAHFHKGDLQAADDTFAKLAREFPGAPRRLEATVEQATVRSQLQRWPQVINLLEQTNGVFQTMVQQGVADDHVVNGYLLLAKAHLAQGQNAAAEGVLARLGKLPLSTFNDWQRLHLLCRVELAGGNAEEALVNSTNLLMVAVNNGQPRLKAESIALQASVLERLGRLSQAIAVYTNNLATGTPLERHREALLKIVELSLKQNTISEAAQMLEQYLTQYTNAPAADLAWLTLGELRLRQCASLNDTNLVLLAGTNAVDSTNCLDQAVAAFNTFTSKFPQSPLLGRAQLGLGWCYWTGLKFPESQVAFQAAVDHLPISADRAMAHFKLADALFQQGKFAAAITNYYAVVEKFSRDSSVETNLCETALYQIVRAGLAQGDLVAATNAAGQIIARYPNGFYADRAVLITGQAIGGRNPELARKMFSELAQQAPATSLRPELELAVARTYEEENRWSDAAQAYDRWLVSFTNHILEARAEYSRAWANSKANQETNALIQFTNFLARFQTDPFAPLAQWWVADYYRAQGDFPEAEINYKFCYQNTNWSASSELAYQARMMAGRCAVARYDWKVAKEDYFQKLINDTNCPSDVQAQAWFAFGSASMSQTSLETTNKMPDYREAIDAFDKIPLFFPTNPIAVLAVGEKACCLLQLARSSQEFTSVTNAFQKVIDSPLADIRARSIAKVGLAITLEKLAEQSAGTDRITLYMAARDQYLDVLNGKLRRPGEEPDPFWTKEAGLKVYRLLADILKQRAQAIKTLEELQTTIPGLRLEDRINALKAQDQQASPQNL
jgi:TolA-binding protein